MPANVTPEQLADFLDTGEEFVLLDTRAEESYDAWHVPGAEQFRFVPDDSLTEEHLADLESLLDGRDRILTICAKGISSDALAAELLAEGYDDVASVSGGMEAWSQVYEVVPMDVDGRAEILQIQRRAKGCLGYVVADPETGEAAVVDPTRHVDEFRAAAADRDWEIVRVFDTHVHADHVSGGRDLADELGVPYHLGAAARERGVEYEFEPLASNEVVEVGDVQMKAVRAPGHTTEMVNYLVDDAAILTADSLHVDSVGRTELEFGDDPEQGARLQYESLHRTLLAEPDSVAVLPGHVEVTNEGEFEGGRPGDPVATTIGEARTGHDLLRLGEAAFVERLTRDNPEKPPNFERVIDVNRGAESVDAEEATGLEMGPNRCSA